MSDTLVKLLEDLSYHIISHDGPVKLLDVGLSPFPNAMMQSNRFRDASIRPSAAIKSDRNAMITCPALPHANRQRTFAAYP